MSEIEFLGLCVVVASVLHPIITMLMDEHFIRMHGERND